jgi:hypothetical protein
MARNSRLPVADLGRVSDFLNGLEDANDKRDKIVRKAVIDTALIWGGAKIWEAYRHSKKRGRR